MREFSTTKMQGYYTARTDDGEWYTPAAIIDRAKALMGGVIDLDPFSSDLAQQTVGARRYLTKHDDALVARSPIGETLWCNPPYGRAMSHCIRRTLDEFDRSWTEGVILVNNATDTLWFQSLAQYASAMLLFGKRIKFIHPEGTLIDRNTRGQIAVYVGLNTKGFTHAFHDLGTVVYL